MALASRFPSLVELPVYAKSKQNNQNSIFPKCYDKTNKKINYTVNEFKRPTINMKQLGILMEGEPYDPTDEKYDYHDYFMKNYRNIFKEEQIKIKPVKKTVQPSIEPKKTVPAISYYDSITKENNIEEIKPKRDIKSSHDIRVHIQKNRPVNINEKDVDPEIKLNELTKRLKKLIRKFPFERKESENREIFLILIEFEEFRTLFQTGTDEKLMEKFCAYATLETVSAMETPVFGHFAFYVVLKGEVKPMSTPHLNTYNTKLRNKTPEPIDPTKTLGVGSCFGTITELEDRDITTNMFRIMTLEDNCEFLKLSFEGFEKITKKLLAEENLEKYNVIKNCKAYSAWPKHAIEELIDIFEWRSYSANTIIASEGYRCPFIGFIVKGVCHVLRKVDIKVYSKKQKAETKKMKQVVIGKLKDHESFGEKSVTMNEQMHCTIVTESVCELGVIPCDRITELYNITVRLLLQTDNSSFSSLTQEDLNRKFIEQEKKKEWKEFKNSVVNNVINKYGIVQGYGKHADC